MQASATPAAKRDFESRGPAGRSLWACAVVSMLLLARAAHASPIVSFEWDPVSTEVAPGTLQVSVDLIARQNGGADAPSPWDSCFPAPSLESLEWPSAPSAQRSPLRTRPSVARSESLF